ncbi:MAG: YqgE/AlgH family protein [Legionellales bacterium]|nr:YqgE/AlgH family protein [Legionellales bacterium]
MIKFNESTTKYRNLNRMSNSNYLTNQVLIAMPNLADPTFSGTVIYVCDHNEEGAMGIILNRPMAICLGDILEQMSIKSELSHVASSPILAGGPVSKEQGFILHHYDTFTWQSTLKMSDTLALTTSKDILQSIAEGNGPPNHLVSLGYSGWTAGQLEKEIMQNSWLSVPADDSIIFKQPFGKRYQAAIAKLGINLSHLSWQTGHC